MDFILKEEFVERYKKEILPDLMMFELERITYLEKQKKRLIYHFSVFFPFLLSWILFELAHSHYIYQAEKMLKIWGDTPLVWLILVSLLWSIVLLPGTIHLFRNQDFNLKIKSLFLNKILKILGDFNWTKIDNYKTKMVPVIDTCLEGKFDDVAFIIKEIVDIKSRYVKFDVIIEFDSKRILDRTLFSSEGLKAITEKIKTVYKSNSVSYKKNGEKIKIKIRTNTENFGLSHIKVPLNSLLFVESLYDKIYLVKETIKFFNTILI